MKQITKFSILALILIFSTQSASSFISIPDTDKETVVTPNPFAGMTVSDFLELTPKKYTELTGKKMKLSQKISLKIGQHKVKKALKKGQIPDLNATMAAGIDFSDFNIAGFILGLILGILGVLIAYLIGDSNIIKWAWLGFAVWILFILIVVII